MKERIERNIKPEILGKPESVEDEALLGKEIAEMAEMVRTDNAKAAQATEAVLEQGEVGLDKIQFASPKQKEAAKEKLKQTQSKIQKLISEFREASYMFMKLIVFSGAVLAGPNPGITSLETPEQSIQRARQELKVKGITHEQRRAYKFVVNDALYAAITPICYGARDPKQLIRNIVYGRERPEAQALAWDSREDAWRLYLGLPQTHNTFGISDYRPSKSKDNAYCYKINGYWEQFFTRVDRVERSNPQIIKRIVDEQRKYNRGYRDEDMYVMGVYWITSGIDEKGPYIAYYDRWDLDKVKIEGEKGFFGKPLGIYDRIYYNPATFEPIGLNPQVIKDIRKELGLLP